MSGKYKFKRNPKKGMVIWLTGLPCSGKTTISKEIEKFFKELNLSVQRLDGDVLRKTVCKDLGYSKEDRDKNIERAAYLAKMLSENGINVIVAFVSPYEKMRRFARKICSNFIEVYVKCDLRECVRRDDKGMYKKAIKGEMKNFTGVSDPYEEPSEPDLILRTDKYSLADNMRKVKNFLKK